MTEPVLEIPFSGGIDESVRDELVDAARAFSVLNDGRQNQRGGYDKRPGYAAMTTNYSSGLLTGTLSSGLFCFDHKGTPCIVDSTRKLYAYSASLTTWIDRGQLPNAKFRLIDTPCMSSASSGSATGTSVVDITRVGNYIVTAHAAQPGSGGVAIYASIQDITGTVVRPLELVVQGSVAETTCALGSYNGRYAVLIVVDGNSANIQAYYLDTNTPTTLNGGWGFIGNVATDHTTSGTGSVAIATQTLSDRVAFAYVNSSGGASQLTVKTVNISGVVETQTINTSSVKPDVLTVEGSISDTLWIAWNETTSVKVIGIGGNALSSTLAATATLVTTSVAPTAIGVVSSSTLGSGTVVVNDGDARRLYARPFLTTGFAVVASSGTATFYAAQMRSRPFRYSTGVYVLVSPDNATSANAQNTLIVAEIALTTPATVTLRPVANIEPRLAKSTAQDRCHWETGATSNTYVCALGVVSSSVSTAARLVELDFTPARSRPVTFNDATYIEGGVLSLFDGVRVAEAGFLYSPSKPTTAVSGTGITLGTGRRYVAVYEESEANGNWAISAVSVPSESTGAVTNKTITVTTEPYTITNRLRSATNDVRTRVTFYATADGGEPPYYRLASVYMTPTATTVSYADTTVDATLETRQLLYGDGNLPETDGAKLQKHAPPGLRHLTAYNGMLVGACGRNLWYTAQQVDGESLWFHDELTLPLDADVEAMDAQDGTLYPFAASAIFATAGDPPNDNNTQGGLGTARRLGVASGAASNVTVATQLGIVYESSRGLDLLTRGGQTVEEIGTNISETVASYPTIAGAVADQAASLIRVARAASESGGLVSGEGVDLVYDLTLKTWVSVDRKLVTASVATPAQHAAMLYVSDAWRYCWLRSNGTLYYETDTQFLDVSTWPTKRAITGWVHIAGLQGEQFIDRVLLLAKRITGHDLTISMAFDYSETYTFTKTFTAAQIAALTREWLDTGPTQTTHQAVKVKIEDAAPSSGVTGTGEGGTWVALTFSGQPHQKAKRTSSAQRGGS